MPTALDAPPELFPSSARYSAPGLLGGREYADWNCHDQKSSSGPRSSGPACSSRHPVGTT
jgi:hypothetical protein